MHHAKRNNENNEEGHDQDSRNQCKRYKKAIDSSADELVCPLTLELPMDPAIAEDGKVYERTAIEEHIKKNSLNLKSPITNERMGGRLLPALQVRNIIEQLVSSGAIDGDKAVRWNEELYKRSKVAALRQKAESGDAKAMYKLANSYHCGEGVKHDKSMAYFWYKRAADNGDVRGTAVAGWSLIEGIGVDGNISLGLVLLSKAEEAGSNVAAFYLGKSFCTGDLGLPQDPVQGKKLLGKVVDGSCKFKHLRQQCLEEARNLLQELDAPAMITPEPS